MRKLKPCTIGGVDYPSHVAAAAALGVTRQRIHQLAAQCGRRPPPSAPGRAKPDQPPTRNAVKILRRVAALLESSIWIRRLPSPHHCEIVKARHILQQQADLLAES